MTNSIVPSIIKSYKGKNIRINSIDQYVCLTDMATAGGKLVNDWLRLNTTSAYLKAFELATGIPVATLLNVGEGTIGTWAHPKIAIRFAQWCSPEFAIQVDFWIDELLSTGSVEIKPQTEIERARAYLAALEAKAELEIVNSQLVEENQQLSEAVDELFSYSSIIRIAKFNKCDEKLFNWRLLKNASINLGVEIKKVPCPRYQVKSLYSHDVWRLAYPAFNLPETTTLTIVTAQPLAV
jgi:KilA-N domain